MLPSRTPPDPNNPGSSLRYVTVPACPDRLWNLSAQASMEPAAAAAKYAKVFNVSIGAREIDWDAVAARSANPAAAAAAAPPHGGHSNGFDPPLPPPPSPPPTVPSPPSPVVDPPYPSTEERVYFYCTLRKRTPPRGGERQTQKTTKNRPTTAFPVYCRHGIVARLFIRLSPCPRVCSMPMFSPISQCGRQQHLHDHHRRHRRCVRCTRRRRRCSDGRWSGGRHDCNSRLGRTRAGGHAVWGR